MRERTVAVAPGIGLRVYEWDDGVMGEGVPVLMVHGLASNARLWDGVSEHLAGRGHPAAAADQRGHGRSSKPDEGYDFSTVASDLVAVVDALGFQRPVVAGQSWGANVVLELALRHPERVRGVVCVDGGTRDLQDRLPTWEECAERLAPPRLAGRPLRDMEAWAQRAHGDWPEAGVRGQLANFEVREDGTIAPWLTFERHMMILRHLWEHRPSELFARLTVPVLFMPSSGDPAGAELAAAQVRTARVHAFPGAHHDVHAQKPAAVAAVIDAAIEDGFFS